MPHCPRHQQGQSEQEGHPQHWTPTAHVPPTLAEGPQRHPDVEHIAHEQRRKQRAHNLLLEGRRKRKMPRTGMQDEGIDDADERADVRELQDGHERRKRELRRRTAGRPGRLVIVRLEAVNQKRERVRARTAWKRTFCGEAMAPMNPARVNNGS